MDDCFLTHVWMMHRIRQNAKYCGCRQHYMNIVLNHAIKRNLDALKLAAVRDCPLLTLLVWAQAWKLVA